MATEILQKVGTQIRFFVTGSFSPADAGTNWTIGTPTDVVLTLSALANAAGRQSAKVDLGATRAAAYELLGCVDFTGETPVAGERVDYYWAPSTSGTQGSGNVAGNSGADGAAPDGALGSITLPEFLKQCIFIGSLVVHDGGVVQNGFVGILHPPGRYGQLIVVNESDDAFEADDVEMHQVLNPIVDEAQTA
jgi:hypothetical protein